ncbi:MAG: FAD-dependent oxidoreductase [Candidatus Nanopelagicales bacterium]
MAAPCDRDLGGVLVAGRAREGSQHLRSRHDSAPGVGQRPQHLQAGGSQRQDSPVQHRGAPADQQPPGRRGEGLCVERLEAGDDDPAPLSNERAIQLGRPLRGAVVGGGLLGLEAAGALKALGVGTTVAEFAPRLIALQVDQGGAEALRRLIEALGVDVRTATATFALRAGTAGQVARMAFEGGDRIDVDVVVFAAWVRPRDELARASRLYVDPSAGLPPRQAFGTRMSPAGTAGDRWDERVRPGDQDPRLEGDAAI